MGSEWVRLTPFAGRGAAFAELQQRDDFDCVNIRAGYSRVTLTHTELNALSRYAPEAKAREEQVEALVRVCQKDVDPAIARMGGTFSEALRELAAQLRPGFIDWSIWLVAQADEIEDALDNIKGAGDV